MTLPEIVLPKIDLPFDIPLLWHPAVIHFLIALPIVILLLELMNLIMKKKAVGGVSFFLLLITVIFSGLAYFTGLADGKEAFPALSEVAKSDLSAHKLLGTYLMLGSVLVLLLKLLAITGNKVLRGIYIFVLIFFVVVMFKQGNDGGKLVYGHGLNVKQLETAEERLFDLNESLEETQEELDEALKRIAELEVEEQNASCKIVPKKPETNHSAVEAEETLPVFTPTSTATNAAESDVKTAEVITAEIKDANLSPSEVESSAVAKKALIEQNTTLLSPALMEAEVNATH